MVDSERPAPTRRTAADLDRLGDRGTARHPRGWRSGRRRRDRDCQKRAGRIGSVPGTLVAHVEVHDPRAYEALLRSGSVGLGASYIAGWWDADDLTAFLRALFGRTRPLLDLMDRLGRAVGERARRPGAAGCAGPR